MLHLEAAAAQGRLTRSNPWDRSRHASVPARAIWAACLPEFVKDRSLPDARQLSDEVLQALRLRAIRGCELGYTETEVAELLGLARETVSRWWSAYAESGEQALPGDRTGRPVGSGRTLNDGQAAWLRTILVGKQPEDVGIASPLWTREAVRALIKKEYGIDMPVRTVGEYLRRWGFTPKAPRRHSRDQDPEEVRRWLDEEYPAIERRAAREGAEILWCDETGAAAVSIDVSAGISRVVQDVHDRRKRRRLPDDLSVPGASPDLGGERQALLPEVQQDLAGDAQASELAEQVVKPARTARSGSFTTSPASVPTKPTGNERVRSPRRALFQRPS